MERTVEEGLCFGLTVVCYISAAWRFCGRRNSRKLKELYTYTMCALHLSKVGLLKNTTIIANELLRKIWAQLHHHSGDILVLSSHGIFLFLPVSNSALLSSTAPWKMATPSVLQTFSRLHCKNTPGPKPELMSILDHLEEERLFFWLRIIELHFKSESKLLFSLYWIQITQIPEVCPWLLSTWCQNFLMKSETFSQLCEFFVLKSKSSAIWQVSRTAEQSTDALLWMEAVESCR